ncbi:MAG: hypothetical protein WAK26_08295 [Terracidiphilus sp.]
MRTPILRNARFVAATIHAATDPPRDRTTRAAKAVEHCKAEWSQAYAIAQEKGLSAPKALRMACVAYKLAMPQMDTLPGIRGAITCIAHGITLEVFDGRDGSQLLYAAQVALSVLNRKGKKA